MKLREIHWPDSPQQGDIHTEGGRTWEYVVMPPDSSVAGVWRDAGCKELSGIGPSWTLEDVKDWLGITDPDLDGSVGAAMRVTVAFVERYCNRLFEWRENHLERIYEAKGNGWQVHLWPIVGSVFVSGSKTAFEIDNQTGILWFKNYRIEPPVMAQFSGGYKADEWPDDLLMVLYSAVKRQWEIMLGGDTADKVSRITVPDVGTISYNAGTSWSTDIGLGTNFGPLSQSDQVVLNLYRLWEC